MLMQADLFRQRGITEFLHPVKNLVAKVVAFPKRLLREGVDCIPFEPNTVCWIRQPGKCDFGRLIFLNAHAPSKSQRAPSDEGGVKGCTVVGINRRQS